MQLAACSCPSRLTSPLFPEDTTQIEPSLLHRTEPPQANRRTIQKPQTRNCHKLVTKTSAWAHQAFDSSCPRIPLRKSSARPQAPLLSKISSHATLRLPSLNQNGRGPSMMVQQSSTACSASQPQFRANQR